MHIETLTDILGFIIAVSNYKSNGKPLSNVVVTTLTFANKRLHCFFVLASGFIIKL